MALQAIATPEELRENINTIMQMKRISQADIIRAFEALDDGRDCNPGGIYRALSSDYADKNAVRKIETTQCARIAKVLKVSLELLVSANMDRKQEFRELKKKYPEEKTDV